MNKFPMWSLAPNAMSQSGVGAKGTKPIGGDFSVVFDWRAGFIPTSFQLANGPGSLRSNIGVPCPPPPRENPNAVAANRAALDKTFVDAYRTPHTAKLHVVERWKVTDGGKVLEVNVKRNQHYDRVEQSLTEQICAENNRNLFDYQIPVSNQPDF
jgi:hypothetical protein